ncbi:MAG: hypothetical protein CSA97_04720, partial [Bacteroidetes bacterium]
MEKTPGAMYTSSVRHQAKTTLRRVLLPLLLALLLPPAIHAEEMLLPRPESLVNDSAHLLTPAENQRLETALRRYMDSTTIQIFIVTVPDYKGLAPVDFATQIGSQWGAGQKDRDNGVIILL